MISYIKKGQQQYKANLHCHSTKSDGKLEPEMLKKNYRDHGYSILAITDHEVPYDHTAMSEEDFLMLTGYEAYIRTTEDGHYDIYKPEIHINLFAEDPHNVAMVNYNACYCKYIKDPEVKEKMPKVGSQEPREYTVDYINKFVQTAKEHGYICAHNHPTWSLETPEQISQYEGFFSMEMCNYGALLDVGMEYNLHMYQRLLSEGKRLCVHSTDDNHNKKTPDDPKWDSYGGFTMVLADELTYPSVFEALKTGNFYSSMGPKILELTFDGNKVHIETEPAKWIIMHDGSKRPPMVMGDDEHPITSADFEIPERSPFVQFNVRDFEGRYADTRGFFRDELGLE